MHPLIFGGTLKANEGCKWYPSMCMHERVVQLVHIFPSCFLVALGEMTASDPKTELMSCKLMSIVSGGTRSAFYCLMRVAFFCRWAIQSMVSSRTTSIFVFCSWAASSPLFQFFLRHCLQVRDSYICLHPCLWKQGLIRKSCSSRS